MNHTIRKSPAERIATVMHGANRPPSPDSIASLRKVQGEIRAFLEAQNPVPEVVQEPARQEAPEPVSQDAPEPASVDAAWMVMEAANDFGDRATIDACRRVIDASLNGGTAMASDVAVVDNYFK
jgi:hypothetical protein